MGLLDLGFEWPVDDGGYRMASAEKPPPSKLRLQAVPGVPFPIEVEEGGSMLLGGGKPERIVRKGGRIRWARPLEFHPTLYLDFAKLDGRPETCAEFAGRFGFLGQWLGWGEARDRKQLVAELDYESVSDWQRAIANMRSAVALSQSNPQALLQGRHQIQITRLDAVLVPSPSDGAALRIRPRSLIGAMYLQFAQAVSSGLDIRTCEQCGKLFEAGGDRRRRDARFCSDDCRVAHHNLRKRSKS